MKAVGNETIFLFPSRFEPVKNPEIILQALRLIDSKRIRVIFSGYRQKDHYRMWWRWSKRYGINSRITFLPEEKTDTEIFRLYRIAHCTLFPSLSMELFGYVALESITCGIPVIGSNAGAVPEMLHQIDTRLIVHTNEPREYAEKMQWFMGLGQSERKSLSERCKLIAHKYNGENSKAGFDTLVNSLFLCS